MKLKENPTPYMGEVRTKVKLFNNADANAAAEGKLPAEKVRVIEADAMVDTGAVRSCIPASLLEKMDLLVDCTRQRLVPAHEEGPLNKVK